MSKLFDSRAAVLECEAKQRLIEKEIELEMLRQQRAPAQWVGLTDEQLKPLIQKAMRYYGHNPEHWTLTAGAGFCILARDIEAAHGITREKK